jgi:hypothetical protein
MEWHIAGHIFHAQFTQVAAGLLFDLEDEDVLLRNVTMAVLNTIRCPTC